MSTRTSKPGKTATPAAADDDDSLSEQQELAAEPEPLTDDVEVEELISNLGASAAAARIIVHRIEANVDPEECIDCPLPVFSKDQLRETYGPGRYRCEVRHKGVIKRRWEWRFAAPVRSATATPAADPVARRIAELEAEARTVREREAQRAHEMQLALIGRPQQQGLQLADLVDVLAKTRELLGGGGEKGSTLAQLKELLEVRELLGGDGGGSGPADVAIEGLKALREAFTLGPPAAPAAARIAATPAGNGSAPTAASSASSRISVALQAIAKHAAGGTPPERVAPFIMQAMTQLPDAEYDAVCNFIEQDGAVGLVLMVEPGLGNFRPWVEQVIAQLRAQIAAADQEQQTPAPA